MPTQGHPWPEGPDHPDWQRQITSAKILGEKKETRELPIPIEWTRACAARVQELRSELQRSWVGLELPDGDHLIDWVLAALIARENVLLLGEPGVAKTQMAERTFRLLGLETPAVHEIPAVPPESGDYRGWWEKREAEERTRQKYFRYLLSRFTQPEELFGPIEISLLRRGLLVHVNFGLLTGPGVRAAFLDEIFLASSSILNQLLTLVLEREYFNWGGMRRADLMMLIGASNELPGGFATGSSVRGNGAEDFNTLYAFLDRFPIRLHIPNASGGTETEAENSNLAKAARKAINRAAQQFTRHDPFDEVNWGRLGPPSVNDLLLLGRAMLEQDAGVKGFVLFDPTQLARFTQAFYRIGASLQQEGTGVREGIISWSVSPRKLMALYKIALAHALVRSNSLGESGAASGPDEIDLRVFEWIWDTPGRRDELAKQVHAGVRRHMARGV
ncbi:MAG TPA: AAA family ATPase [Bryobacteraceae bacterium]|nr:AAA family ATPase [Bryobacteraceae bacterium]